jgi:hypothetical protein
MIGYSSFTWSHSLLYRVRALAVRSFSRSIIFSAVPLSSHPSLSPSIPIEARKAFPPAGVENEEVITTNLPLSFTNTQDKKLPAELMATIDAIVNGPKPIIPRTVKNPLTANDIIQRREYMDKFHGPAYRITQNVDPLPLSPTHNLSAINGLNYSIVYCALNTVTGERYIGSCANGRTRLTKNFELGQIYSKRQTFIMRSLLWYTSDSFLWYVLADHVPDRRDRLAIEKKYIDLWKPELNKLTIPTNNEGTQLTEADKLYRSHISMGNTRAPGVITIITCIATNPLAPTIPIPGVAKGVIPNTETSINPLSSLVTDGVKSNIPHYNPDTQT